MIPRRALLAAPLLAVHPARAADRPAELVMVTTPGCPWCAKWQRELGAIYPKTQEGRRAPLRQVDIRSNAEGVTLLEPLRYTPTFLLVAESREIGRVTGYQGQDSFWFLLDQLIARLDKAP